MMTNPIMTIGHSSRSLADFLSILREARVDLLVDVRSFPRSRTNPVFNIDTLPGDLAREHIDYRHCPVLGGRRPKQPQVDKQINAMWRVQAFHNYADYALSAEFEDAFRDLVDLSAEHRLAVMCSEAVWWRCHRRIITDYLLCHGRAVDHLMGPGRIDPAKLTDGAQKTADGRVVYPAD